MAYDDLRKNAEGYSDPTAYEAMKNLDKGRFEGERVFKKICILASLSQQSAIEEAVQHFKAQGCLVDYPIEQRDKTLFEIDFDYICRIAAADMVVAIPKYDGNFGESVTYELAVAKYLGKPRRVYCPYRSSQPDEV